MLGLGFFVIEFCGGPIVGGEALASQKTAGTSGGFNQSDGGTLRTKVRICIEILGKI